MANYNDFEVEELNFDDILMQEDDSNCWNPNAVDQQQQPQQYSGFVEEHSLQPLQNVPFNMQESAAAFSCENAIGRQHIFQQQQNCNFGEWQQFHQQQQPMVQIGQMQQQQPTQDHNFVMSGQHARHLWPEFNYQQRQKSHPFPDVQTTQFQQLDQFEQPLEIGIGNQQFGRNGMHPYPKGQQQEMMVHIGHPNQQQHYGYPPAANQQQLVGNESTMASTIVGHRQQQSSLPEAQKEKQQQKAQITENEKVKKRSKARNETIAEKNKIIKSPKFQELVNVAMTGISCLTAFLMLKTVSKEIPQFIKKRSKKAQRKEEQTFVGLAAKKKGGKRGKSVQRKEYKTEEAKIKYIRIRVEEMIYKISSDEGRNSFAYMFANTSKNDGGPWHRKNSHIFAKEKVNLNADDKPKNGVVKQNKMKIFDGEINFLALTLIIKREMPIYSVEIDQKMICLHNCHKIAPKGQFCVNPFHYEIRALTAFDKYRFELEYGKRIEDFAMAHHNSSSSQFQAHSASSSSAAAQIEFAHENDPDPEQQLVPLFFNQMHFEEEEFYSGIE